MHIQCILYAQSMQLRCKLNADSMDIRCKLNANEMQIQCMSDVHPMQIQCKLTIRQTVKCHIDNVSDPLVDTHQPKSRYILSWLALFEAQFFLFCAFGFQTQKAITALVSRMGKSEIRGILCLRSTWNSILRSATDVEALIAWSLQCAL